MSKPYSRINESGVHLSKTVESSVGIFPPSDPITYRANHRFLSFASGETCPQWESLIRNAEGATTPFLGVEVSVKQTPGAVHANGFVANNPIPQNRRTCSVTGDLDQNDYTSWFLGAASTASAEAAAASKFYSKVHNAMVTIEGGELLGELGQTVGSIRKLARGGTNLLKDWRRSVSRAKRIFRSGRRLTGAISDAYLEWKFGWDPLAADVIGLATKLKDDFVEILTVKATGTAQKIQSVEDLSFNDNPYCPCKSVMTRGDEVSIRYKAGLRLKRYGVGGLAETLGLSPRNFLPTFYNLLPWTYMIDYYTNLGAIVNAIAFDTSRIAWSNKTIRTIQFVDVVCGVQATDPPAVGWINSPGYPIVSPSRVRYERKTVQRTAGIPEIPRLDRRMPDFSTEGGRIQGLNIAAVLASRTFGHNTFGSRG